MVRPLMRVALVNKFFFPNAGAETVFFLERDLLAERGNEVIDFAMQSDRNIPSPYSQYFAPERGYQGVSKAMAVRSAAASIYSVQARRAFERLLRETRPDVVHFHNIYHQLTLSLVDAAQAVGIPTVLTLHDYKIGCPAYTIYRDGQPCRECVGKSPAGVLRHSCIKGSRPASLLGYLEAELARRRNLYERIDALIAPSAFIGGIAADTGYPRERIHVVPNALSGEEVDGAPASASLRPEPQFVFAGRLEGVKGIDRLLPLFVDGKVDGTLTVIGDGPLRADVEEAARRSDRVDYLGRRPRAEVVAAYAGARAAVVPSRWEENCPMSLLEARAGGAAVVCSASGGLTDLVEDGVDGLLVGASDDAWAAALNRLAADPEAAQTLATAGLDRLRRDHSPDAHYAALIRTYEAAGALSHA